MPYINEVHCEAIQCGVAVSPPIAAAEFWPSIDPQGVFSVQNWGISNFIGIHNQLGLFNGIGAQSITGTDFVLGLNMNLGITNDAVPAFDGAAVNWSQASPSGKFFGKLDVIGSLTENGTPVDLVSDIKLKANITPLENCLDKVMQLQGVEYDRIDLNKHQIGFIAQEVEAVIPDLVEENSQGTKVLHYKNLTAVLVEAIKEQQEQINSLKETVQELSTKLAECCS
jgi:hypothetical protein